MRKAEKPPRKHDPRWKDNTVTARSDKRKAELQAAAVLNGFVTWSGMMTFIKNEALKGRAWRNNVKRNLFQSQKEFYNE